MAFYWLKMLIIPDQNSISFTIFQSFSSQHTRLLRLWRLKLMPLCVPECLYFSKLTVIVMLCYGKTVICFNLLNILGVLLCVVWSTEIIFDCRYGGLSFHSNGEGERVKVWYNSKGHHSLPAYQSAYFNTLLRSRLPSDKDASKYGNVFKSVSLQASWVILVPPKF